MNAMKLKFIINKICIVTIRILSRKKYMATIQNASASNGRAVTRSEGRAIQTNPAFSKCLVRTLRPTQAPIRLVTMFSTMIPINPGQVT